MIETRCHELARKALEDTLKVADFKEVLIFTDKPALIKIPGAKYVLVEDWPDKLGWAKCYWHDTPQHIQPNDHALLIQWDSWALDPSMWKQEYLKYDYIGAPWAYGDGRDVGNSGFGMRSGRLMNYMLMEADKYPVTTSAEDALLSRTYRGAVEKDGFTWAPNDLALDFAFENVRRSPTSKHFGFHGMFNWPFVMEYDDYKERLDMAKKNVHIAKSDMFTQLGRIPFFVE